MLTVFHSFLLYPVGAVLKDGHSTGQASTNFKIGNVKKVSCFAFFNAGILLYLPSAKCNTSVLVINMLQIGCFVFRRSSQKWKKNTVKLRR